MGISLFTETVKATGFIAPPVVHFQVSLYTQL